MRVKSGEGHHDCTWPESGGSLVALQELLGHAAISTTQRYARLTDAAVQSEAARVMENIRLSGAWAKLYNQLKILGLAP